MDAGISCAAIVPVAGWLATAGKGGKWVAKADDFFKNPEFTVCALPKSFSGTSARAFAPNGDTAWPVEYGGVIGENGETFVCAVTRHSKKKFRVITAYPSPDATCPRN
ncbi:hypothetical protein [Streptomyces anulatus]|uniref:hypothetical protein n=1 Tax=Streptomyces anulatus TaxID=1892 RepID=UPI0033319D44